MTCVFSALFFTENMKRNLSPCDTKKLCRHGDIFAKLKMAKKKEALKQINCLEKWPLTNPARAQGKSAL